jgi:hypothetical protein
MGWKASCIVATSHPGTGLTSFPAHDPEHARRLLALLPLPNHELKGETTFEQGVYPTNEQLFLGAYGPTVLIGHAMLANTCLEEPGTPPVIEALNKLMPGCEALAFVLHSVVNLYGYALFRGRQRVRVRWGSGDDGVVRDEGDWLPEEAPLFAKSEVRDGERIFQWECGGELEEFDHSGAGEEFVFTLTKRFLGTRLDEFNLWDLKMEEFHPVHKSFWKRLFGG